MAFAQESRRYSQTLRLLSQLTCARPGLTRWRPVTCGAAAVEGAFSICALAVETARGARAAFVHVCKSGVGAQKGSPGAEGLVGMIGKGTKDFQD